MRRARRFMAALGLCTWMSATLSLGCGAPQQEATVVNLTAAPPPPVALTEEPEIAEPAAPRQRDPSPSSEPHDETRADETRSRARALFQEGVQAYEQANYQKACDSFQAAYDLVPVQPLLFNIGSCQLRMGNVAGACASFRQYVANGNPQDARIQEVTQQISQRCRGVP